MSSGSWAGVILLATSVAFFWGRCWLTKRSQLETGQIISQRWGGHIADFFYFVGWPYAAVVSGLLSVQWLGLRGLEFYSLMQFSADASLGLWLAEVWRATMRLGVTWLLDSRALLGPGLLILLLWSGALLGLTRAAALELESRLSLLAAIYDGLHWAFYRAIFWLLTGDLFYAVLLGGCLAALELAIERYFLPELTPQQIIRAAILVLTAALFYYSPNLWGVWLVHLVLVMIANYLVVGGEPLQAGKIADLTPTNPNH